MREERPLPLRVLLVGPTSPPYTGIESATESLVQALHRTPGIAVRHVDTRKPVPNAGRGHASWVNLLWALRHLGSLLKACLEHRPDVVHLPMAHNRLGFLRDACFVLLARAFRARLVLQAHNDSYDKFVQLQGPMFRLLVGTIYRLASAIAVPGASLRGQFERLGVADRVTVLANHLDVAAFSGSNQARPSARVYTLLLLGRVTIGKGAWDLVRAGLEAAQGLGETVRIELAGEVVRTDESVAHMAHRSADVPTLVANLLQENQGSLLEVSYLGVLDKAARERALAQADVLVLPSYSEALPYSILEGAAAGLPVIATEVGMIPELRACGLRGEFVRAGDVPGLAKAITALADPSRRDACGRANQALVASVFDVSLLPMKLQRLYASVMGGSQAPMDAR